MGYAHRIPLTVEDMHHCCKPEIMDGMFKGIHEGRVIEHGVKPQSPNPPTEINYSAEENIVDDEVPPRMGLVD